MSFLPEPLYDYCKMYGENSVRVGKIRHTETKFGQTPIEQKFRSQNTSPAKNYPTLHKNITRTNSIFSAKNVLVMCRIKKKS